MAKERPKAESAADQPTLPTPPSASGTDPKTATLQADPTVKVGGTIGPYKLLDELGEGGMGTVYLAEQERPVRRRVALKVIKPGLDTAQVIARFEAERQALALMDHPNIARVVDAGATTSGRPFFVMELVQGVPITSYCDQHRLPLRERLELFVPICRAVQHAHQKGIIHRDLKPSNILVTLRDDQPVPKIIDFGIAKATTQRLTERTLYTQHGHLVGTPDYMSPEQAGLGGLDVDTRSDVYSLGAMLYELLCGETPLGHRQLRQLDFVTMLNTIYEAEPPPPSRRLTDLGAKITDVARRRDIEPHRLRQSLHGELDWIVTKALEKERVRRYESASALAADIERYLNNQPVEACPPSATYRLQKFVRRNRAPLAAAAAIALVLVGGIIVSGWQAYRATQAEQEMAIERQGALDAKAKAEGLLAAVDEARKLAEAQKKLADQQRIEAVKAKNLADEAGTKLAAALAKANDAANRESTARAEIEQRLREADAMRLAMSAKDSRDRYPQRALLLAAEAVEATRRKNEPIRAAAHQALREALDTVGGRPMSGHDNLVSFAEVSPGGRWLFTSDHATVRRWDLAADDPVETSTLIGAPSFSHRAWAISPDGRWLVTASQSNDATKLNVWDLKTEKLDQPARQFDVPIQRGYSISGAVFNADARWLAAWNWQEAWAWDLTTESKSASPITLRPNGNNINPLAITPNGRWAIALDHSRNVTIWGLADSVPRPPPRQLIDPQAGSVDSSQISPDGRWLVALDRSSASAAWTKVWDFNADDPFASPRVLPLDRARRWYQSLHHFAADGRTLAVAIGDTITLWDLSAEKLDAPRLTLSPGDLPGQATGETLPRDNIQIQRMITDREARWLLAVDQNGYLRAWDLNAADPNGSRLEIGRHGNGADVQLTLSASGRWLVSTKPGEPPRLWDLWRQNPEVAGLELRSHDSSPHHRVDVAIGGGRLTALGTPGQPLRLPLFGWDRQVRASLGLGERWLVTRGWDATPRLWDLKAEHPGRSGVQAGTFKLDANDVAVRDDGNWVIRRNFSEMQVINPDKRDRVLASVAIRLFASGWSSGDRALSRDGRWLAVRAGEQINVYDVSSDELLGGQLNTSGNNQLASSPPRDQRPEAEDQSAVWHSAVEGGRWLQQILNPQLARNRMVPPGGQQPYAEIEIDRNTYLNQVVISPNGRWLLCRGNNEWRLWNLKDKETTVPAIEFGADGRPVVASAAKPSSTFKVARSVGEFLGGTPIQSGPRWTTLHLSFSPDGRWLVAYRRIQPSTRLEILLWDLTADPPRSTSTEHDLVGSYSIGQNTLAFSADGRLLASNTGGVRVWEIADDGGLSEPEILSTQSAGGDGLAVSPDGRYVASADNQIIRLWDRTEPDPAARQRQLHGHDQSVEELAFSPDGRWLVSGSQDGEVRLWDLRDDELQDTMVTLSVRPNGDRQFFNFQGFYFSPDGRWLAASSHNGAHFWQLDPAGLLDEARRLAGRELNADELARYRLNTPERQRDRYLRKAEQISKQLAESPQDAALLRQRVEQYAFAGELHKAIDDLRLLMRLQPDDHWLPYYMLPLLAQTNLSEEYRRVGQEMAERFRDPPPANYEILERVAKGRLFWAESGSDWTQLAPLGDRALKKATENSHWVIPWAQIAKAMGEYRLGNHRAALQWADKGLAHSNSATVYSIAVPGNFVKAVSHAQLGQMKEAQAALVAAKKAHAAVPTPLQAWSGWHDWYMCDIMLREADAVLLAKSPPTDIKETADP